MHDSKLIRRYTLDRAGIMFVTDLIRDTLTSSTPRRNAIAPEMEVITTLNYNPKSEKVGTVWKTQIKKRSSDF